MAAFFNMVVRMTKKVQTIRDNNLPHCSVIKDPSQLLTQ